LPTRSGPASSGGHRGLVRGCRRGSQRGPRLARAARDEEGCATRCGFECHPAHTTREMKGE